MRGRIAKRVVDALKPVVHDDGSRSPQRLWDTDVTGFGCFVTKAGSKSFIFQYRLKGQARNTAPKRITIAKYGDLTPDEARKIARGLLLQARSGNDPSTAWKKEKGRTFDDLAKEFMDNYLPNKKRPPRESTIRNYEVLVRLHLLPAFSRRQVGDISRADLERLHLKLRDRPYMANRMLSVARQMFKQAERLGWRDQNTNPAELVERYQEEKRGAKKAVMLSAEQMSRLLAAIRSFEKDHHGDPYGCAAIEFAFWTGWRISEVLGLQWENLDVESGTAWLLKTKTAADEYRVLPVEALKVLDRVARISGVPSVFVGKGGTSGLTTVKRPWQKIRELACLDDLGELGALRLHDLRHNVVSWDVSRGVPLELAGRSIGHRSVQATEVYAHFAPDALKRSVDSRARAMREASELLSGIDG